MTSLQNPLSMACGYEKARKSWGFATETAKALLRYAFGALGLRRVSVTHSDSNEASRRIAEKLGLAPEGVQRLAAVLPGGRLADRHRYARHDIAGLPALDVEWPAAVVPTFSGVSDTPP